VAILLNPLTPTVAIWL